MNCTSLKNLYIPESVAQIGEEVFVLVHKLYITNENRTYVLENEIKHADTYVVI